MILTLTPNPAFDLTVTLGELARGETNRVLPARVRAGGKGINVARVLSEQGHESLAVAAVGSADIAEFSRDLDGVAHDLVPATAPTRRSYALVETGDNVTTILNETGSPQSDDVWVRVTEVIARRLPHAGGLVISGSVPPDSPDDLVGRFVSLGVAAGVPVIADATGAQLLSAARAGASVLKPNRHELAETVPGADPIDGARRLQELGAGLVLVSLGEEGMIAVPRDPDAAVLRARLPRVLTGNPTGAGDAAVAGVASLLAAGEHNTRTLLIRATAWSAAAVLMPGAGSIHADHAALENDLQITVC